MRYPTDKMIETCRQFLSYFNPVFVQEVPAGIVEIIEANPSGAGTARFTLLGPAVKIVAKEAGPLLWALASGRCADGALITFDEHGDPHLHLVELKSKLTPKAWAHVRTQYDGMLFAAMSVARLLGLPNPKSVRCYVLFSQDAITTNPAQSSSPTLLKTTVGGTSTIGGLEDWMNSLVQLPYSLQAVLYKSVKDNAMIGDFGAV